MRDRLVRQAPAGLFIACALALLAGCKAGFALYDSPPHVEGTTRIRITPKYTFEPQEVEVTSGDTVVWVNESPIVHRVSDDPRWASGVGFPDGADPFDSSGIQPGGGYSRVPTVPGVYTYACPEHAQLGMTGRIVVKKGPEKPPPR